MNQASAIHTINELLPEINRTRDPGTVLLKYASDNNLAPAQLERLGQVFNTAKTISYMEKSASRGGSFTLLDVEDMLGRYMDLDTTVATGLDKKASSSIKEAAKPFSVPTLWDSFDKKASTPQKYVDQHWEDLKKIAAEQVRAFEEKEDLEFCEGLITLKQVLFDEIHGGLAKLAHTIYENGPEVFEALERDSQASPYKNENALEYLAQTMDRDYLGAYKRNDLTKLAAVKVVKDTTGLLAQLDSLEDNIQLYDQTRNLMLEKVAAGVDPFSSLDGLKNLPPGPDPTDEELELIKSLGFPSQINPTPDKPSEATTENTGGDSGSTTAHAFASGAEKEKEDPEEKSEGDTSEDEDNSAFDRDLVERTRSSAREGIMQRMSLAAGSEWKEPKVEEKPEAKPNAYDKGLAKVDAMISPIAEARIKWLRDAMVKKPTHNTMGLVRDNARQDVGRIATLQRAIMNDDVLSGADPERVASLYNTLYRANPEMMSDPNVMSAALREAVQYDGVMPHTYEQFVGTAKQRAEQETKALELNDRKYKL